MIESPKSNKSPQNAKPTADKYVILNAESTNFLGKNEFGTIFKAKKINPATNEDPYVLIKQVSKKVDPRYIKEEVDKFAQISSLEPNLLPLREFYEDKSYYYIVTPYCNKGTLSAFITNEELYSEYDVLDYFRQIAYGLKVLHSKNIVVKGLTTEDILVNVKDGKTKMVIADYGLSRSIGDSKGYSKMLNLLAARAPESTQGVYDESSDIYALGCILYKMLTRKELFAGTTESELAEQQKSYISIIADSKWSLSELTLYILEGCLQYDKKTRMTMDELRIKMDLDYYYSSYRMLNLGVKTNNVFSSRSRTITDAKSYSFANIADFVHSPIKILDRKLEMDQKDLEISKLKQEVENIKYLCEALKKRQDSFDSDIKEKSSTISIHKLDIESLKQDILSVKGATKAELDKVNNSVCDLQDNINIRNSQLLAEVEREKAEFGDYKKANAFELNKLHSDFLSMQEVYNSKITQLIVDSKIADLAKGDANDSKKQMLVLKEAYSSEINSLQLQIKQMGESIKQSIASPNKESKSDGATGCNCASDLAKLQSLINQVQDGLYSKITKEFKVFTDFMGNGKADIEKLKLQISQVQQSNLALSDSIAPRISKAISESTEIGKQIAQMEGVSEPFYLEIKKLQSQINNIVENCKMDSNGVKKPITADLNSTEFNKLQSQIYQMQDLLKSNIDKLNAEFAEYKNYKITINANEVTSLIGLELAKHNNKIYDLQESINQRFALYAGDFKAFSGMIEKFKLEFAEIKKYYTENKKVEEINRITALFFELQDQVNQRIIKKTDAEKQVAEDITVIKAEINALANTIERLKVGPSSAEMEKYHNQLQAYQEVTNSKVTKFTADYKILLGYYEASKQDSEELKKATKANTADISKLQPLINSMHEKILKSKLASDVKALLDAVEVHKNEIAELKKQTTNPDVQKLQANISQLHETINSKISLFTKEIKALSDKMESFKADNDNTKQAISSLKADCATSMSKYKIHETQISKVLFNIEQVSTSLHTLEQRVGSIAAEIDVLKVVRSNEDPQSFSELTIFPVIQDIINKLNYLELMVKGGSPKTDITFHLFKTMDKITMKIELHNTKFRILDMNGSLKDEIYINEISLLKLDDSNRCVALTRKAPISPSKSLKGSTSPVKTISMQLYADSLPDAIELYKFIRNAHLIQSSDKKLSSVQTP